jgi:Tfp pilus assembly protein PilP
MSVKHYLMKSLIVACAWGAMNAARAEDISAASVHVPTPNAEKPVERVSLQSLKNLRDPFKRLGLENIDSREEKPKSELETVPVSDFKMVGVLTGPYKTRALVRSPNGNVYTVSDGTRIGVQNGYVRKVLRDRIIVNEIMQDVLGEKELVTSELKLNPKGFEKGVSSVSAVISPGSKKSEGDESRSKDKPDENNAPSAPPASKPAAQVAPAAASAAPASAAPAATGISALAAPVVGNSFQSSVPAPVSLPQTNSVQKTAGSR